MTLKEQIRNDLKNSLKEGNEVSCSVLRFLLASIQSKQTEKQFALSKKGTVPEDKLKEESELNDEETMSAILSDVKKRKDSISAFEKGGRQDLVEKEKNELLVLQKYLPEQLSEEEIKKVAERAIKKIGASSIKEMGKVMAEAMIELKGKADGTLVSKVIKSLLS
ncbi:MAG: aspartyl-tRNA amidotransferase [Candidatus Nealsonbacteria bacterium CG_4_8_14_3_um_filter_39_7]|uniref:Aspartyl-tRNA amidotransferase n=1 Tax=Candidatus Nealsonbacteria bacterium CG23_combo_of_CG06-09_8_20_14_all_39_17 TaxID=1974722 RepID=A0A2G9YUM7_9BACT|nr:MAG: aspartyl-tRNA amidotransferase [Candidatus Nealsonbacteria bacterium CG23_combo_of_CG06-09_8_20_14_all_39_17]PIU43708.1 MAG: aspartyl-tRNA amidotransferase [Candidatus Nealsonbacteria bacterium CG07_land_8_20_14_0_80_39_13]PIW91130.1 MAG: aspartyl-tRNA amidotransferase [Candidatus Nealsonbacteria bacterium CG_4_8_14_3_um_filter_39_7]